MASTNFSYGTVITSIWLNDVNLAAYTTLPALSTTVSGIQSSLTTLTGTTIPNGLASKQDTSAKDTTGGYVGLTGYNINFKNVANTFTSAFTNTNTAARTYAFPDKNLTVAGTTNETFTKPTITGYIEQFQALNSAATITVNPDLGTLIQITVSTNMAITLPAAAAGVSYTLIAAFTGGFSLTFTGGTSLRWLGGTAPTATSVNGKIDKYIFTCGATYTLAQDGGRNF